MKYNRIMGIALILSLMGAVSILIGTLAPRTALGQILWFIGLALLVTAMILIISVKLRVKRQNRNEKNKW